MGGPFYPAALDEALRQDVLSLARRLNLTPGEALAQSVKILGMILDVQATGAELFVIGGPGGIKQLKITPRATPPERSAR